MIKAKEEQKMTVIEPGKTYEIDKDELYRISDTKGRPIGPNPFKCPSNYPGEIFKKVLSETERPEDQHIVKINKNEGEKKDK